MFDGTKILTENQNEINRLYEYAVKLMQSDKPQNNNYLSFASDGGKLRFHFRKSMLKGELIGFRHLEICLSPHYYFNNYLHNGNCFTPHQSIICFKEIFDTLRILDEVLSDYRVVNLEFGINIIPHYDAKRLVDLVGFYRRTNFRIKGFPYFKITDTSKAKLFKIYHKGIQFPKYSEVNPNTLRIEFRLKNSRAIKKVGISSAKDLLKIEKFAKLFEHLLIDFENVFFCDTPEFFVQIKKDRTNANRNNWGISKDKYLKNNPQITALKTHIKSLIIDTYLKMLESANTPQKTTFKIEKEKLFKPNRNKINDVFAQDHKFCMVTGMEISMQKNCSKFLGVTGLQYYFENDNKSFKNIEIRFLSKKVKSESIEKQFDNIAHNIRNSSSNKLHNYTKFKQRNYSPNQLQFKFKN